LVQEVGLLQGDLSELKGCRGRVEQNLNHLKQLQREVEADLEWKAGLVKADEEMLEAVKGLRRSGPYPSSPKQEPAPPMEEEPQEEMVLLSNAMQELRRVFDRYSILPHLDDQPDTAEGLSRQQFQRLLVDCELWSHEAGTVYDEHMTGFDCEDGSGTGEVLFWGDFKLVMREIAGNYVPIQYQGEVQDPNPEVQLENLVNKYILWGATIFYGEILADEDAGADMEKLFVQAEGSLRVSFDHYARNGAMTAMQVSEYCRDFEISPHMLTGAEVARLANWAGSESLGGQLDYDHFCLLLAKVATIGLALPPPHAQYANSTLRLEKLLEILDQADQMTLVHEKAGKERGPRFTLQQRPEEDPLSPWVQGYGNPLTGEVTFISHPQGWQAVWMNEITGEVTAINPKLMALQDEAPAKIPEIDTDWQPRMPPTRVEAFDAAMVADMLYDWVQETSLLQTLSGLHKHYSIMKGGEPLLQVNQFVKMMQDAGVRSPIISASDTVAIYCQTTEPGGMTLRKFLSCVTVLVARQKQLYTLQEVLDESQELVLSKLAPFARLVQEKVLKVAPRALPLTAEPLSSNEDKIGAMLQKAYAKFNEFDVDQNGYLEGPEIVQLALWVWSSFRPGNKPLTEQQKRAQAEKLLKRHDGNSDGKMHFTEFAEYFETTAKKIEQFRLQQEQRK